MTLQRRDFIKTLSAGALLAGVGTLGGLSGCASPGGGRLGHLVIIGGGFAGATLAKYTRMWSDGDVRVTLIERNPEFVSCPMSNLVLAGERKIEEITHSYESLGKYGIRVVRGEVTAIDADKRQVRLANGETIAYDRLAVAPGIDFLWDKVPGLTPEIANTRFFHAWRAGPQTVGLRKQLEAMRDGGVFAIAIPEVPYRCPPGPYERACLVAHYFKTHKPKSKVLILDANPDVQSKKALFMAAWKDLYPNIIEYRPDHDIESFDAGSGTLKFKDHGTLKPDVLNLIPPQRAGDIAHQAGLTNVGNRWCAVDWRTLESTARPGIHVLGDATQIAPGMPKSGHMATQHAKVAAAAIVRLMKGEPVIEPAVIANTCYSFVDDKQAVHVASVHAYDDKEKTYKIVPGSGGVSQARNIIEGRYGWAWAQNIWADMLR